MDILDPVSTIFDQFDWKNTADSYPDHVLGSSTEENLTPTGDT